MRKLVTIALSLFAALTSVKAQLTRQNWMVGGDASFSTIKGKNSNLGSGSTVSNLRLQPQIGYFFVDKLAGGLSVVYENDKYTYGNGMTKSHNYSAGPFVRYYFLPTESQANVFSQAGYEYSYSNGASDVYNLEAGAVMFFNMSVGLEFTAQYSMIRNHDQSQFDFNTLRLGIGLQVHLEKE